MPQLEVRLQGPLLISGGHASALGIDLATTRRMVEGDLVPCIPATALRGAVRIQLEALLRGAGREATGPYPLDGEASPDDRRDDPVARLFGHSGPTGQRAGSKEGELRFGDALPEDRHRAVQVLKVRAGVELDDATSTAASRKLFFREVAEVGPEPLSFLADVEVGSASEGDLQLLRAAVETTEAIGAGKATGGGQVAIRWIENDAGTGATAVGDPRQAVRARISLTLLEPAHFGDGGPFGNHHATRRFIPGATLRGAVAWTLLRNNRVRPEDAAFQALFLGDASFGDALLTPSPAEEPCVHPATLQERESEDGGHYFDTLAVELARASVNPLLAAYGMYFRSDSGDLKWRSAAPRPAAGLLLRTRTRVSIHRQSGTAAHGRLFTIEQIEPWIAPKAAASEAAGYPPCFVAWVEGLSPEAAELLEKIAGLPVFVGAGRNHGLGRVGLEVRLEATEPDLHEAQRRTELLAEAVAEGRRKLLERAGVEANDGRDEPTAEIPLALVAQSDYIPSTDACHPLAELDQRQVRLERRFLHLGHNGGYDQRPDKVRSGPLKELLPSIGAGSVFVYSVARGDLRDLLQTVLPRLRRGVGRRTESGCGRFEIFQDKSTGEVEP